MSKSTSTDRWVVSWSTVYDTSIKDAHEAVVVALGDIEDALRTVGLGKNVFIVEDTHTGSISVITSDVALSTVTQQNTIINVDQSVTYSPSVTINVDNKKKKGKK